MKNRLFKSWSKVFSFTFKNMVSQKAFVSLSVIIALLLFLLPSVIMPIVELTSDDDSNKQYPCDANEIFVVMTDAFSHEFEERYLLEIAFSDNRFPDMSGLTYTPVKDLDEAKQKSEQNTSSLVLYVINSNGYYECSVLLPDNTSLDTEDGENYQTFISNYYPFLFVPESSLSLGQISLLLLPTVTLNGDDSETSGQEAVIEVLSFALPYVIVMFLYFMVLFYGQNISGNVLLEKTSKLVDSMLLSIPPEAMILGKVLGGAAAAILQFFIWLASVVGGFAVGTFAVKMINKNSTMGIIQFFDSLDMFEGMFSVGGIALGVAIIILGFLMYCALAAISGAIASKQEDLSSTQSIFVLVLVFSFILSIQSFTSESGAPISDWLYYIPFTAIMLMPGNLILGEATLLQGGISVAILAATCILIIVCAGKIYRSLIFYRGNVPKPKDIIAILLNKQS